MIFDTLIAYLKRLGYNLNTLEYYNEYMHFMYNQHLIMIKKLGEGYELNINSADSRYKTKVDSEYRLAIKLADYFC